MFLTKIPKIINLTILSLCTCKALLDPTVLSLWSVLFPSVTTPPKHSAACEPEPAGAVLPAPQPNLSPMLND